MFGQMKVVVSTHLVNEEKFNLCEQNSVMIPDRDEYLYLVQGHNTHQFLVRLSHFSPYTLEINDHSYDLDKMLTVVMLLICMSGLG